MRNFKNKRILITGGSGFLGRHLLEYLNNNCDTEQVINYIDRLENVECLQNIINSLNPNVIIHLAAIPVTKLDDNNPNKVLETNIIGTHNLLRLAPQNCRFVMASSVTVYGDIIEGCPALTEQSDCRPTSIYAVTKLAAENLVDIYSRQEKIEGINLRFCAITGKYSTHGIIFDFIRKLRSDSEYLEVLGDTPGSCKPFVYADDACKAIVKAVNRVKIYNVDRNINICNMDKVDVLEIATTVMKELGITKPIKWLGNAANWKGDNKIIYCSNQKADRILAWRPKYNSLEAITQCVKDVLC